MKIRFYLNNYVKTHQYPVQYTKGPICKKSNSKKCSVGIKQIIYLYNELILFSLCEFHFTLCRSNNMLTIDAHATFH